MEIEGKIYKEIKTSDKKKYMKKYNQEHYSTNRDKLKKIKNTKNLLKKYDVNDEIKNEFKEYLYDFKQLLDISKNIPNELLQIIISNYINNPDEIFVKKNILENDNNNDNNDENVNNDEINC